MGSEMCIRDSIRRCTGNLLGAKLLIHHSSSIIHDSSSRTLRPLLVVPLTQEAQAHPHDPHTVNAFLQASLALNFIRLRKPQACADTGFTGSFFVTTLLWALALLVCFDGMLAQGQGSRRPRNQGLRLECTQHKHTMSVYTCPSGPHKHTLGRRPPQASSFSCDCPLVPPPTYRECLQQ